MGTRQPRVREKRWVRGWISYEKELVLLEWVMPLVWRAEGKGRGVPDVDWAYRGRRGWLCGVIDHAEQHIQRWKDGYHGIIMNSDLVVIFIVVE